MGQIQKAERLFVAHKERLAGGTGNAAGSLRGTMGFNDRDEGMNGYIPGYNASSPRSQGEMLTDYLVNEF